MFSRKSVWSRHAWVIPALFVGASAQAGEKIRYTSPGKSTDTDSRPDRSLRDDGSGPFDLQRDRPAGGEAPPVAPPSSNSRLSPKTLELLEQKKNWILRTPSGSGDAAPNKSFTVREQEFGGPAKKPSGFIERYFEREAEARKEISARTGSKDREDSLQSDSKDDTLGKQRETNRNREESNKSEESKLGSDLNSSSLITKPSSKNAIGSSLNSDLIPRSFGADKDISGTFRRTLGSSTDILTPQEQRLKDFEKNALGRIGSGIAVDPISTLQDATRQPLNPVLGGLSVSPNSGLNTGLSDVGVTPLAGAGIRSGIIDTFGSRGLGGSSLSPGFTMPTASPFLHQRPGVLEIPRRRF
ncbi:MAG: hypothetical protein EXS31_00110 [Pedosphaera sp.]|nr:hypothetical protein [Pedosphaera sp.]